MVRSGFYFYLPHHTQALFAGRFRQLIAAADKPCLREPVPPIEISPYWGRPNMVGRILYDISIPQYEKLLTRRCEGDFRLTAAATAAALEAYRVDHGRFPATLAALAPGYLPAAPVDPFTGAAPLYTGSGEIRSAGTDDEGKAL